MAEDALWYYSNEGEQAGPVTPDQLQQLAAQGMITPATSLWSEGLPEWVSATEVEGLFEQAPPAAAPAAPVLLAPTATPAPAPAAAPAPVAGAAVTPITSAAAPAPAGAAPMAAQIPEGGDYPVEVIKKASFGKILGFLLGGMATMILAFFISGAVAKNAVEKAGPMGEPDTGSMLATGGIFLGGICVGSILCILGGVFALMALHRAWHIIRWNQPRTTPGKAVGFLFIPTFNIYWIYVAYRGLAEDWNRTMASFPDLTLAPKMSSGLFLTYCICVWSILGLVVAPILQLVMFAQICKGINFMASRAAMQARPGGLQLY